MGGLLGCAAPQPLADLHAERRPLLPARGPADVLLGRLRLVPRARPARRAAASGARMVGGRGSDARPRHAEQVRGGALGRGRRPLRPHASRAASLARVTRDPTSPWPSRSCIFSPVVVWNAQHRWVSFFFQSTRGVEDFAGIRPDWLLKNIAGQAIAILPWLWAGLVVELVDRVCAAPAQPARQFIAWLSVTPIVLFTGVAAWSSTSQHHFHWATPGLSPALPAARRDGCIEGSTRGSRSTDGRSARPLRSRYPDHRADEPHRHRLAPGPARPVPRPLRHRGSDLRVRGHDGPRARVSPSAGFSTDPTCSSSRIGGSGRARWTTRLKGRLPVLAFTRGRSARLRILRRAKRYLGKDGILVTTKTPAEVAGRFERYFARITPLGEVRVGRRDRAEYTLYLYRGERLTMPYPQPYGESRRRRDGS